jgi:hypothetical protein
MPGETVMAMSLVGLSRAAAPARVSTVTSSVKEVSLDWSPGQGVKPRPGQRPLRWGLYVGASVQTGHQLTVGKVKVNKSTRSLSFVLEATGQKTAGNGSSRQDRFVSGAFSRKAEKWHVVVRDDAGRVLARRTMELGGPLAA